MRCFLATFFGVLLLCAAAHASGVVAQRQIGDVSRLYISVPSGTKLTAVRQPDALTIELVCGCGDGVGVETPVPPLSAVDAAGGVVRIHLLRPVRLLGAVLHGNQFIVDMDRGSDDLLPASVQQVAHEKQDKVVVIDAGHGGYDPGAVGAGGVREKAVTLAIARALAAELQKQPRVRVLLTRDKDVFLSLGERAAFAINARADVFVSIHADSYAADKNAQGAGLYVRSDVPSDPVSAALALKENATPAADGGQAADIPPSVRTLMDSILSEEQRKNSARLAAAVERALNRNHVALLPAPNRQAAFFVLRQPTPAALLVETGFLTNADEARTLTKQTGQQAMARALAQGITAYLAQ